MDGDDDFGYDRTAIDASRLISPQRDCVYSDLREHRIAADAREFAWGTVDSNEGADAYRAFQAALTGIGRITRLNALYDGRRFVIRKRSVLYGRRIQFCVEGALLEIACIGSSPSGRSVGLPWSLVGGDVKSPVFAANIPLATPCPISTTIVRTASRPTKKITQPSTKAIARRDGWRLRRTKRGDTAVVRASDLCPICFVGSSSMSGGGAAPRRERVVGSKAASLPSACSIVSCAIKSITC